MFFRDVLRRWRERQGDAVRGGVRVLVPCEAPESLVGELAADGEDFADLAAVLNVDLHAVVTTLASAEPPRSPAELVTALTARPASAAPTVETEPQYAASALGGGEAVGWGRWTRVRGGTRVHLEAIEREIARERETAKAVRPAMAAS